MVSSLSPASMKTFAFLIVFGCVTAKVLTAQTTTTTTTTPAPPPFTVVCKSDQSAKLTLTDTVKTIAEKGTCTPTQTTTTGTYTLDDCLHGGTFIVEPIATLKDNKKVVTNGKEYKVSCTESNDPIIVTVSSSLTVNGPSGSPVTETITFSSSMQPLFMTLLTNEPQTTQINKQVHPTSAKLGTRLYLTIVENQGKLNLIPLSCVAGTVKTSNTTIWNYAKNSGCTYEQTIMKTGFTNKDTADPQHVTYAEIVAFQFADDPTGEITFTCQVQECRSSDHDCPDDLSNCQPPATNQNPITQNPNASNRRRRNVDDAKIHHLTARLRISEDFAVHGGSDTVHYALSGVLLSVLIQIIL